MSALNRQSHATNDQPLWVSSSGNTVVNGNITANYITAKSGFELKDNSNPANTIFTLAAATNGVTGNPIFQTASGGAFRFGQFSQSSANTTITPSAPGSNLDLLKVGGTVQGSYLNLKNTGGDASIGTATLVAGTVVVNTTTSDVNAIILLTRGAVNGSTALGELRVSNKGANNFTIVSAQPGTPTSTETGDVSDVMWMIINPSV